MTQAQFFRHWIDHDMDDAIWALSSDSPYAYEDCLSALQSLADHVTRALSIDLVDVAWVGACAYRELENLKAARCEWPKEETQ